MRSRNIKPGFYKNEKLAECSVWARFICPGLWMMADRKGRLEDRPKRIKAELLAYDVVDAEPLIEELIRHGHMYRYEVNGTTYLQILNFVKHQSPHHTEKDSDIPEPPKNAHGKFTVKEAPASTPFTVKSPLNPSLQTTIHGDAPGASRETSGSNPGSHTPPSPPDSLIPDLLIPESPSGDVRARVRESEKPKQDNKLPNLSRLPFDSLPPEWAQWVQADMGWNAETTADVWACFRDYWQGKTGKSAKKSDWGATWRVWCRKETVRNSGVNYAKTSGYSNQNYRPNKSERAKAALIESAIELGYAPNAGRDRES